MSNDGVCGCGCAAEKQNQVRVVWQVPNIKCEGCAETLGKALKGIDGISCLLVNAGEKKVTLSFDQSRIGPAELRKRLADAGFPVEL